MSVDLTPGRKSITERYGVRIPRHELGAILVRQVGPTLAREVLDELIELEGRYSRAARVEQLRRRYWPPQEYTDLTRREREAQTRNLLILEHAEAFIAGSWEPPPVFPEKRGEHE